MFHKLINAYKHIIKLEKYLIKKGHIDFLYDLDDTNNVSTKANMCIVYHDLRKELIFKTNMIPKLEHEYKMLDLLFNNNWDDYNKLEKKKEEINSYKQRIKELEKIFGEL